MTDDEPVSDTSRASSDQMVYPNHHHPPSFLLISCPQQREPTSSKPTTKKSKVVRVNDKGNKRADTDLSAKSPLNASFQFNDEDLVVSFSSVCETTYRSIS